MSLFPLKERQKKKAKKTSDIQAFISKVEQVHAILFSKYVANDLKKATFRTLKYIGKYQVGLSKIWKLLSTVKKEEALNKVKLYAQKVEK